MPGKDTYYTSVPGKDTCLCEQRIQTQEPTKAKIAFCNITVDRIAQLYTFGCQGNRRQLFHFSLGTELHYAYGLGVLPIERKRAYNTIV